MTARVLSLSTVLILIINSIVYIKSESITHNVVNISSYKELAIVIIVSGNYSSIDTFAFCGQFGQTYLNVSTCYDNTDVKRVTIRNQNLQFINNSFYPMIKLEFLNLAENKIIRINNDAFIDLNNLLELYINNNNITQIDSGLFNSLERLKQIDISNNEIKVLPSNIFKYQTKLRTLFLQGNKLYSLDLNMFSFNKKLLGINVKYNDIVLLTGNLSVLKELNIIYASHNNIDKLRLLGLKDYLSTGATIMLNGNKRSIGFDCSDRWILSNKNKSSLNIIGNDTNLFFISNSRRMNNKRNISLECFLDVSRKNCKKYKKIITRYRSMCLPDTMDTNKKYKSITQMVVRSSLNMLKNEIMIIAGDYTNIEENAFCEMAYLHEDEEDMCIQNDRINSIVISHQNLSILNSSFYPVPNLDKLYLADNAISDIKSEAFLGLYNLTQLSLKKNKIKKIQSNLFNSLRRLKHIDISKNEIEMLSHQTFLYQTELKSLSMERNKLYSLDLTMFGFNSELKKINVNFNQIVLLEGNISQVGQLKNIKISNNYIDELRLTGLKQYLYNGNALTINNNNRAIGFDCKFRWMFFNKEYDRLSVLGRNTEMYFMSKDTTKLINIPTSCLFNYNISVSSCKKYIKYILKYKTICSQENDNISIGQMMSRNAPIVISSILMILSILVIAIVILKFRKEKTYTNSFNSKKNSIVQSGNLEYSY